MLGPKKRAEAIQPPGVPVIGDPIDGSGGESDLAAGLFAQEPFVFADLIIGARVFQ